MWLRRRTTVTPASRGPRETVNAAVETVTERLIAAMVREAEREREAEEQARLDASAAHVRDHVKRWGSWFPSDD